MLKIGRTMVGKPVGLTLLAVLLSFAPTLYADDEDPVEQSTVTEFLDFETLQRPSTPNHWLAAPSNASPDLEANVAAPVIMQPAAALARAWKAIVESSARTKLLGMSADGLQIEAEQRSRVFGFVDRISFLAVPIDDKTATFFAYSRSQVGYWDGGVNRTRLNRWIGALSP